MDIASVSKGTISKNLQILREKIEVACKNANRDPKEITLVAVVKYQTDETIKNLYEIGIRNFGENRLQQLEAHQEYFQSNNIDIEREVVWNFIGQIQKNKLSKIVNRSDVIQSIDSVELLEMISKKDISPKLYIQLAANDDISRGGVRFSNAGALMDKALELNLMISGVMIVPPLDIDPKSCFNAAKQFALAHNLKDLSMGMTGDYESAIECGSTTLRIGSAIFAS